MAEKASASAMFGAVVHRHSRADTLPQSAGNGEYTYGGHHGRRRVVEKGLERRRSGCRSWSEETRGRGSAKSKLLQEETGRIGGDVVIRAGGPGEVLKGKKALFWRLGAISPALAVPSGATNASLGLEQPDRPCHVPRL